MSVPHRPHPRTYAAAAAGVARAPAPTTSFQPRMDLDPRLHGYSPSSSYHYDAPARAAPYSTGAGMPSYYPPARAAPYSTGAGLPDYYPQARAAPYSTGAGVDSYYPPASESPYHADPFASSSRAAAPPRPLSDPYPRSTHTPARSNPYAYEPAPVAAARSGFDYDPVLAGYDNRPVAPLYGRGGY